MDKLQYREQPVIRLADNPEVPWFRIPCHVNISPGDPDGLTWQADQPLDIGLLRVPWKPEDHDLPSFRIPESIGKLVHQYPVTGKRTLVRIRDLVQFHRVPAVRAGCRNNLPVELHIRVLGTCSRLVTIPALGTVCFHVPALQRGGHRTGRNDKCLDNKRAKHESQDDRHGDRLNRLAL